jgi:hypothetical protein
MRKMASGLQPSNVVYIIFPRACALGLGIGHFGSFPGSAEHQLGYFIALHTVAHHGFKRMNPNNVLRDKGFSEMVKPQS